MKTFLATCLTAAATLLASAAVFAEDGKNQYIVPNHVSASISDASATGIIMIFVGAGATLAAPEGQQLDFRMYGGYTLGYERFIGNSRWSLGADMSIIPYSLNYRDNATNEIVSRSSISFAMAMLSAKYTYLAKEHFNLYSNAAVGVLGTFSSGANANGLSGIAPAFQIDLLGFRFGSPRIGGFLEQGAGLRGFVHLGIDFAF